MQKNGWEFIHGSNDNDMLAKIIRELIKAMESTAVTSEQLLVWAKGVETQRAHFTIITSLSKTNAKIPMKQSFSYCHSSHPPRQCPVYGKKCVQLSKVNYFREVCRNGRNRIVHDLEQEPDQHHEEENQVDTMNINSIIFNSKQLVITANQ